MTHLTAPKVATQQAATVLIVVNDPGTRVSLSGVIARSGFRVTTVMGSNTAMRQALSQYCVALVILDLAMPKEGGLSLLAGLRSRDHDVPVILLVGREQRQDGILGLERGADDYVLKPFDSQELSARIKAVLRRAKPRASLRSVEAASYAMKAVARRSFAGWEMDLSARQLISENGELLSLSTGEFDLLQTFVEHPRRILTRDQLLDLTRGQGAFPFDRSVDIQVCRLRRKLGDDGKQPRIIRTVRGVGYIFTPSVLRHGA